MKESYDFDAMLREERIMLNMYLKSYKYRDIYLAMGRLGITYKGKMIRDSTLIEPLIETIKRKYDLNRPDRQ